MMVHFKDINKQLPLGIRDGLEELYLSKVRFGDGGVIVKNHSRRTIEVKISSNHPQQFDWMTDWCEIPPNKEENFWRLNQFGEISIQILTKDGLREMRRTPFALVVVDDTEVYSIESREW